MRNTTLAIILALSTTAAEANSLTDWNSLPNDVRDQIDQSGRTFNSNVARLRRQVLSERARTHPNTGNTSIGEPATPNLYDFY